MKTLSKTILTVLATGVICCGLLSQQAQGGPVVSSDNLADLVTNSGTLTIGDKVFSSFNFFASNAFDGIDASQIQVTALFENGLYFLRYNMNLQVQSGQTGDLSLFYTVTATGGNLIDYIDQRFTGGIAEGTTGNLQVDETVNAGGANLAESHLSAPLDSSDFPGFTEVGDNLFPTGGPQSFLNIEKDIALTSNGPGSVSLSIVSQSFHQSVPDGGSAVALLGIALAGIEGARRIFRARKG